MASSCYNKPMLRKEKLQDNNKWWSFIQKDSSTSQALYTPRQELTINTASVTTDGTITPYAASETINGTIWPQEVGTSEQSNTSNYKQT